MIRNALTMAALAAGISASTAGDEGITAVFASHCISCHGENGKVKGKVDLTGIDSAAALADQPELLADLIGVIEFEEMPPEDEPQLEPDDRAAFLAGLTGLRDRAAAAGLSFPHTPIRRMNRFQYNNAVIDLFELRCIVFTLPERMMRDHGGYFQPGSGKMPDLVTVGSRPLGKSQMIEPRLVGVAAFPQDLRAEHGFDNQADHLSLSPLLMESFLKLGRSITESRDFTAENVGIWNSFFAPPGGDTDPSAAARDRLIGFLSRAFRRPPSPDTVTRYTAHVTRQIEQGIPFSDAMRSAAAAAISSPKFLYLYDGGEGLEKSAPLEPFELASRLSFFLWGSIPDSELLELAANGTLTDPEVLSTQVDRMLGDRKLKRFCDSFPSQWLQLERIISSVPNRERFPSFYFAKYRNSMHMMMEPLLLFETVLIEDLPVDQLIDPGFAYRSHRLHAAYGDLAAGSEPPDKPGNAVGAVAFHRVPIADRRSGGIVTNSAVMTMTSGPERTQPITRGAWVASVIFNNPPKPPPADVPSLDETPPEGEEHLTLRERLSLHRERSDCRGCHEQIDPLGFALENFDAVGQWRSRYENGRDVDMAGTLFRKYPFADVIAFKDAILSEKDRFARALAGHLLAFALARELGPADQVALDRITAAAADQDYRMKALLHQIVASEPFLTKSVADAAGAPAKSPTH